MASYHFTSLMAVKAAISNQKRALEKEKSSFLSSIFPWLKRRKQQRINALDYLLRNLNTENSKFRDFYRQKEYMQTHYPASFSRFANSRNLFRDIENFLTPKNNIENFLTSKNSEDANFSKLKQLFSNRQSLTVSDLYRYCEHYFPTIKKAIYKNFIDKNKLTKESAQAFAEGLQTTQELQVFLMLLFAHLLNNLSRRLPLVITADWLNFSSDYINHCPSKKEVALYPFMLIKAITRNSFLKSCVFEGALTFTDNEDSLDYRLSTGGNLESKLPSRPYLHICVSSKNPRAIDLLFCNPANIQFTTQSLDIGSPFLYIRSGIIAGGSNILLMNTSTPEIVINAYDNTLIVDEGLEYIDPQALDEHTKPLIALFEKNGGRLSIADFLTYCQSNYPELMGKMKRVLKSDHRIDQLIADFRFDPPKLHILIMLLFCHYSGSNTVYQSWVGASNALLTNCKVVNSLDIKLLQLKTIAEQFGPYIDQQIIHFIREEDAEQKVEDNNSCIAYISQKNLAFIRFSYKKNDKFVTDEIAVKRLGEIETFAGVSNAISDISTHIGKEHAAIKLLNEVCQTKNIDKINEATRYLKDLNRWNVHIFGIVISNLKEIFHAGEKLEQIYQTRTVIGFRENHHHLTFRTQKLDAEKKYIGFRSVPTKEKEQLALKIAAIAQIAAKEKLNLPVEIIHIILGFFKTSNLTGKGNYRLFDKVYHLCNAKKEKADPTKMQALTDAPHTRVEKEDEEMKKKL